MTPSGIGAEDPLGKLVASRCPGWSRGGGLAARSRASGSSPAEALSWFAASRSVTHPTRLETRTKESNMCASQWVSRNPMAQ